MIRKVGGDVIGCYRSIRCPQVAGLFIGPLNEEVGVHSVYTECRGHMWLLVRSVSHHKTRGMGSCEVVMRVCQCDDVWVVTSCPFVSSLPKHDASLRVGGVVVRCGWFSVQM